MHILYMYLSIYICISSIRVESDASKDTALTLTCTLSSLLEDHLPICQVSAEPVRSKFSSADVLAILAAQQCKKSHL